MGVAPPPPAVSLGHHSVATPLSSSDHASSVGSPVRIHSRFEFQIGHPKSIQKTLQFVLWLKLFTDLARFQLVNIYKGRYRSHDLL